MFPKRINRSDEHPAFTNSERQLILAAETLRSGDTVSREIRKEDRPTEERISLFWRVFGGTILSICALVVLNSYQSVTNSIHEVRADVGRLRDANGEYIKKDEFNTRSTSVWNSVKELQAIVATVTVLNSKLTAAEQQLATAERERKEVAHELLQLRERLAKLEGRDEAKPAKSSAPSHPGATPGDAGR